MSLRSELFIFLRYGLSYRAQHNHGGARRCAIPSGLTRPGEDDRREYRPRKDRGDGPGRGRHLVRLELQGPHLDRRREVAQAGLVPRRGSDFENGVVAQARYHVRIDCGKKDGQLLRFFFELFVT